MNYHMYRKIQINNSISKLNVSTIRNGPNRQIGEGGMPVRRHELSMPVVFWWLFYYSMTPRIHHHFPSTTVITSGPGPKRAVTGTTSTGDPNPHLSKRSPLDQTPCLSSDPSWPWYGDGEAMKRAVMANVQGKKGAYPVPISTEVPIHVRWRLFFSKWIT